MHNIDTFSAHSLKLLDKNKKEFIDKYFYNLEIRKKDKRATLGQKFHNLIYSYIKGFDISKLLLELDEDDASSWKKIEKFLIDKKNGFIKTEYPFLIKEKLNNKNYYLTGRFDAIYKNNNEYTIYDWKTGNLPKEVKTDLQTIVYLYCASLIFNTTNIKIVYFSIEKIETAEVEFENLKIYKDRIDKIVSKLDD